MNPSVVTQQSGVWKHWLGHSQKRRAARDSFEAAKLHSAKCLDERWSRFPGPPLMAASATFALKAGVWFRRGRLLMISPDSRGTACPPSGRNSTYRPVQISEASSVESLISQLKPMHTSCELKRFGPRGDGGYLLRNDLEGIGACVSSGVSFECGFDKDVADLGIDVYMADASVSKPPIAHEKFIFTKKNFDTFSSDETITIDDFCKNISPGNDLLLQMDIEGAEYKVLKSASEELLMCFRIMVIEFYDLAHIFTRFGLREIASVFQKVLKTHYVVHIHPNNTAQPVSRGLLAVHALLQAVDDAGADLRHSEGSFCRAA